MHVPAHLLARWLLKAGCPWCAAALGLLAIASPGWAQSSEGSSDPGMLSSTADAGGFLLIEHRHEAEASGTAGPGDVAAQRLGQSLRVARSATRAEVDNEIGGLIRLAEARYRLPGRLLEALIFVESGFAPMAVSRAGAAGLAQLMPGTAVDLGVRNRFDPAQN